MVQDKLIKDITYLIRPEIQYNNFTLYQRAQLLPLGWCSSRPDTRSHSGRGLRYHRSRTCTWDQSCWESWDFNKLKLSRLTMNFTLFPQLFAILRMKSSVIQILKDKLKEGLSSTRLGIHLRRSYKGARGTESRVSSPPPPSPHSTWAATQTSGECKFTTWLIVLFSYTYNTHLTTIKKFRQMGRFGGISF